MSNEKPLSDNEQEMTTLLAKAIARYHMDQSTGEVNEVSFSIPEKKNSA